MAHYVNSTTPYEKLYKLHHLLTINGYTEKKPFVLKEPIFVDGAVDMPGWLDFIDDIIISIWPGENRLIEARFKEGGHNTIAKFYEENLEGEDYFNLWYGDKTIDALETLTEQLPAEPAVKNSQQTPY